jgi:hypothetical protein
MDPINPSRIMKALAAIREGTHELEAALADAERPRPSTPPGPMRVYKGRKDPRRIRE